MSLVQIVDGFKYKTEERNIEITNVINWNSKIFDKIHILCENLEYYEYYKQFQSDVVDVVNLDRSHLISMKEMFNYINENSNPEDIKFLSNIDAIYTDQFKNLDVEEDCIYTFNSRSLRNPNYNNGIGHETNIREENDGLVLFNRDGILDPNWFMRDSELNTGYWQNAVCSWGWKTIKPLSESHQDCFQCYPQAEQCMMSAFRKVGYTLKAAGIKYPNYHNHGSNEKTENNKHGMSFNGQITELL
jgi:hypothetical protein